MSNQRILAERYHMFQIKNSNTYMNTPFNSDNAIMDIMSPIAIATYTDSITGKDLISVDIMTYRISTLDIIILMNKADMLYPLTIDVMMNAIDNNEYSDKTLMWFKNSINKNFRSSVNFDDSYNDILVYRYVNNAIYSHDAIPIEHMYATLYDGIKFEVISHDSRYGDIDIYHKVTITGDDEFLKVLHKVLDRESDTFTMMWNNKNDNKYFMTSTDEIEEDEMMGISDMRRHNLNIPDSWKDLIIDFHNNVDFYLYNPTHSFKDFSDETESILSKIKIKLSNK